MKKIEKQRRPLPLLKETVKQLEPEQLGDVAGATISVCRACSTLNPEDPSQNQ